MTPRPSGPHQPAPPLGDLRVIDLATVVAGPGTARYLADFGADVIKVERPGNGDTTRSLGWRHAADNVTYWWKLMGRGKRSIVLDLKSEAGKQTLHELIDSADVLIENFRPGKLEALGFDPDELIARNPKLVVLRVSGFGQSGPYANRAGFATLAEAMSGFAAINGEVDGGPLLPPIALTDEVTALVGAFAVMVAVHSGVGQVVDVNLLESMFQLMGPIFSVYMATGEIPERLGSGIPYTVPRGTFQTADGRWIAISTSAESVAQRVMKLIGAGDDERFATFSGRVEHRDELNELVAHWVAQRTLDQALEAFSQAEAAAAAVYSVADIAADPHFNERQSFVTVDGVTTQGLIAHLSKTPGVSPRPAPSLGQHTEEILAELKDSKTYGTNP
ncbi:MAG: CoA transferase [Acidimicrobiia bacterium]